MEALHKTHWLIARQALHNLLVADGTSGWPILQVWKVSRYSLFSLFSIFDTWAFDSYGFNISSEIPPIPAGNAVILILADHKYSSHLEIAWHAGMDSTKFIKQVSKLRGIEYRKRRIPVLQY